MSSNSLDFKDTMRYNHRQKAWKRGFAYAMKGEETSVIYRVKILSEPDKVC